MARHRSPSGGQPSAVVEAALRQRASSHDSAPSREARTPEDARTSPGSPVSPGSHDSLGSRTGPAHRLAGPTAAARGRLVVAAVAAGAFVAAGQTIDSTQVGDSMSTVSQDAALLSAGLLTGNTAVAGPLRGVGGTPPAPEYLPVTRPAEPAADEAVQAMAKSERLLAEREAREAEAQRPKFALPAAGRLTSGYGPRWGTTHWGIDIANRIGTPIAAAADGVVAEAGPASGFGLWVRLAHADGTTTVYGHINRTLVREGQRVKAGEVIAEMGNRGHSTGPHLHFEVWNGNGQKINPLAWLRQHGISI